MRKNNLTDVRTAITPVSNNLHIQNFNQSNIRFFCIPLNKDCTVHLIFVHKPTSEFTSKANTIICLQNMLEKGM